MKKTCIILMLIVIASFMVMGCKEDKCKFLEDVDGVVLPDECYDCELHASESATLSDTGYNTVNEVRNRYTCHRETLKEHVGDTLRLTGWIYWGGAPNEWIPDYMFGEIGKYIYLTDREDHLDGNRLIMVELSPRLRTTFQERYDELVGEKWYIIGILRGVDHHIGGCCSFEPFLKALELDSINVIIP